jgi:hypothetical protein
MKKDILKIAGVKSEKEFYKKYPTEEAFMAEHGKAFKKAMRGSKIKKAQVGDEVLQLSGEIIPTFEYTPSNVPMYNPYAQPRPTVKTAPLPKTKLGNVKDMGSEPAISSTPTATKAPTNIAPYLQGGVDIVEGLSMIRDQRDAVRSAKQQSELAKIYEKGIATPVQQPRRQYVTPYDLVMQPQQRFPSYGVGTNVLAQDGAMIGGNPTEIQNTFAPNTIYTDLGYEPLNDPSKVKRYETGGDLPIAANGFDFNTFMTRGGGYQMMDNFSQAIQGDMPEAGNKIGRGIGTAAGFAIGGPAGAALLGAAGDIFGGFVDQSEEKIKRYQDLSARSMGNVIGSQLGANLRTGIFGSNMQDGGTTSPYAWVSHTWQPQTITQFGDYKMKDLLRPPHDADMLRAGGHLKAYTPPSARSMSTERPMMQEGGELQTHWGGYAEPMSYNPYLPGGGETIMFRGQSHDESDGKGNTGIGITFGENPVEVERGEPALKLKDGDTGEENLTVFGNIKITNAFADMLGDSKAKGKKFKGYVADLSKQENKLNNKIEKATNEINELEVISSFDKMKLNTLEAVVKGSNQKLKDIADKKENAAALQNAINDSKEEGLLNVTDDGRVLAAKGAKIPKAQTGFDIKPGTRGKLSANFKTGAITYAPLPKSKFTEPGGAETIADVPDNEVTRGASMSEKVEDLTGLDPKIQGLIELLNKKGYAPNVTSGVRPGDRTAQGRESRHSTGQAVDVVFPKIGPEVYDRILKDPEVAGYLLQNGLTIINEYDPTIQQQTGATGPHLHFGFDSGTALSDAFRKQAASMYPDVAVGAGGDPIRNFQSVGDIANYYRQFGYTGGENIDQLQKWIVSQAKTNPAVGNELTTYLRSVPLTNKGKRMYGDATVTSLDSDKLYNQFNDGLWDYRFPRLNSMATTTTTGGGLTTVDLGKREQDIGKGNAFVIPPVEQDAMPGFLRDLIPLMSRRRLQPLDPNQLAGEMFALTNNQVEPVFAQKFTPELDTPYDISLQDILNANQADYNATQRLTGYNPEALSMLNAQKYAANQKVLGEQFRLNQAQRQGVYKENRDILNKAKLVNLEILGSQADKQAKALSATKATTQEALNSISGKYAQNILRQKQYSAAENLFNYRFTPGMRAVNVNPFPTFNLPTVPGLTAMYNPSGNLMYGDIGNPEAPNPFTPIQQPTRTRRGKTGANIARAIKNL